MRLQTTMLRLSGGIGLAVCLSILLLIPILAEGPTLPVADINPGDAHAFPYYLVPFNGAVYFRATDATHGSELWRSDGTLAGTRIVSDINPGTANSYPYLMTVWSNTLYFRATDATYGTELWRSDGTLTGTRIVSDINPGPDSAMPAELVAVADGIYFRAEDGERGTELWHTDGTITGTRIVSDINPGGANSAPIYLTPVDDWLYFGAEGGPHGRELWRTDGTVTGTTLISDINPGSNDGLYSPIAPVPGTTRFIFSGGDGVHGAELWVSDGTPAGTSMLLDIYPGIASAVPYQYVPLTDTVLFVTTDPDHGTELWRSDGTLTGTTIVKDINPGGGGSNPYHLTPMGDALYFRANDGTHGTELWRTDGTEAGTRLVRDIGPGTNELGPESLTVVNDTLFFTANDGLTGNELWVSDGTESGTRLVHDIYAGSGASYPFHFTPVADRLFFTANDGLTGNELWSASYLSLSTETVDAATARPGKSVTYTIRLQNFAVHPVTVSLTDTMPAEVISAELSYPAGGTLIFADETGSAVLPGSGSVILPQPGLAVFSGKLDWVWRGTVGTTTGYTFTLRAHLNPALTRTVTVTNRITVDDGLTAPFDLLPAKTTLLIGGRVYLPLIFKQKAAPVVPTPTPTPEPSYSCAPTYLGSIDVGTQPRAMVLDAGRNRLYVANLNGGGISIIDGQTNAVITAVVGSAANPDISTPNAITYDSENDLIWATGQGSNPGGGNRYRLVPVSADDFSTGDTIELPAEPADLVFNPVNARLYVSFPWLNQVIAYDPLSGATVSSYDVGQRPTNMAVHPTTGAVYVTLFTDSAVAAIRNETVTKIPTYSEEPFGIAIDSERNLIYVTTVKSNRIVTLSAATDQFLGWTEFKRGNGIPVPMRHLAFNPTANAPDGGHLWTTTSTTDMLVPGGKTQVLLIPKGYPGFNQPIPADVPDETGGGLPAAEVIVNSALNRVYVASPYEGIVRVYGDHNTACWSVLSPQWLLRHY